MTSLRDTINTVCTAGSVTYEEFQRAGPCLNSTGAEIHACFQDLKGTLQRAVATAPAKEVIPHSCCAYSDVVECIGRALLPCEGAGARDYFLGLMDRVMGKALKLVCIDYASGSAACKMLPKLPPLVPEDRNMGNYIQLIIEVANTIES
ncbi:hypothetical protein V5799_027593 [Amblyomma americanum]|uniref:Uncharacterized protein n=1 Tax=Amblyomma americanum TaxID=6943 RepID=A0AAQ4DFA0_AMBAM